MYTRHYSRFVRAADKRLALEEAVGLADTSIGSLNLGDQIIMEAVRYEAARALPTRRLLTVPTHVAMDQRSRELARRLPVIVVGGTNLLGGTRFGRRLWKLPMRPGPLRRKFVLLGSGLIAPIERQAARVLRHQVPFLSRDGMHAVRDVSTAKALEKLGFNNVVVSGCPTTWHLSRTWKEAPRNESGIRVPRASELVFTISPADTPETRGAIARAIQVYRHAYLWPQGVHDHLPSECAAANVSVLPPTLKAFREVLQRDVDYLGSRLHGGIYALQHKKRALILAVDHRAIGMGEVSGLPVSPARSFEALERFLQGEMRAKFNVRDEEQRRWRAALRSTVLGHGADGEGCA